MKDGPSSPASSNYGQLKLKTKTKTVDQIISRVEVNFIGVLMEGKPGAATW